MQMIQFEEYYCFPADQVVCVKATEGSDGYLLTVFLKNGTNVGVTYKVKKQRDDAKTSLVIRIERELAREESRLETLSENAYLLKRSLDRLDKRQQKIFKMLNSVLKQKQEEV